MDKNLLQLLINLRITVGYLGEKTQFNWWPSSFYSQGSEAFLSPIFNRTMDLARCSGSTQAAALVHDERIGIGHVYHLFRLPESMEQGIHHALQNKQVGHFNIMDSLDQETAIVNLENLALKSDHSDEGPVRIGAISDLENEESWGKVAGLYLIAFQSDSRFYPYFSDI